MAFFKFCFLIFVCFLDPWHWPIYNENLTRNLVGKYSRVRPVHVASQWDSFKVVKRVGEIVGETRKCVYLYTFVGRYLLVNYREKARSVLKYKVVSSSDFFFTFFSFFRSRRKIVIRYFFYEKYSGHWHKVIL